MDPACCEWCLIGRVVRAKVHAQSKRFAAIAQWLEALSSYYRLPPFSPTADRPLTQRRAYRAEQSSLVCPERHLPRRARTRRKYRVSGIG